MKEQLLKFGLSEKEAETYLTCLKTGEATANRIAELLNFPRSTTYDLLERLKNAGLISTYVKDNKTVFVANSPKTLLLLLDEKQESIKEALPEMEKIYNQIGEKPTAEVFQGKTALIKIFDEILNNAKELMVMGSQGNALEKIGYHPEKFRIKRLENKIKIRQILEISKESKKIPTDELTEIRFMKSFDKSREGTFIFDDHVYHIILQYEITAIKTKSKEHADAMRIMFNELWEKAEEN